MPQTHNNTVITCKSNIYSPVSCLFLVPVCFSFTFSPRLPLSMYYAKCLMASCDLSMVCPPTIALFCTSVPCLQMFLHAHTSFLFFSSNFLHHASFSHSPIIFSIHFFQFQGFKVILPLSFSYHTLSLRNPIPAFSLSFLYFFPFPFLAKGLNVPG